MFNNGKCLKSLFDWYIIFVGCEYIIYVVEKGVYVFKGRRNLLGKIS